MPLPFLQVDLSLVSSTVLMLLRLVMFGLALGLTVISFQAYREQQAKRLERAFIGFAFMSMGAAMSNITARVVEGVSGALRDAFLIVETIPFIVGFAMLYLSLRR